MKILFLSRWFPYPPDNGSKQRVLNLLKHLATSHQVDLISFTSHPVRQEHLEEMRTICRRVDTTMFTEFNPTRLKALAGLVSPLPRLLVDTHSPAMQSLVQQAAQRENYDLVIASQLAMVPYAEYFPGQPRIFEEIELTTFYEKFNLESSPLKRFRGKLTWWKAARYVAGVLRRYAGGTVVSEIERARVEEVAPGYSPIQIVPNGVAVGQLSGVSGPLEPGSLVYSGSLTYAANFDAVEFFLSQIFPLVRAARPDVRLYITGRLEGVPLERLPSSEGVIFTGFLQDVRPRIAQSWVNVVPIRKGGGTRLKILESLALGTPVVSTTKGVEGLDLQSGEHLLTADSPEDFASAVLSLLEDPAERQRLSQNGCRAVAERYDWDKIGPAFVSFVEHIVQA